MKNMLHIIKSKLDNLIIKILGKSGQIDPINELPELSTNEVFNYISKSIESNVNSLIIMTIILGAIKFAIVLLSN